jgi:hypothetical protein
MSSFIRQCPDCKTLTEDIGGNRAKRVPSITTLPNVPQEKCQFDCIKKPEKKFQVDRAEMNRVTEEGIEKGFDNANEEWRAMALNCLYNLCLARETFTVNELRDIVKRSPLKTHDNRAMGGVMATGKKEGWLTPTGQTIPSVVGHKVHIQIWKSLLYKKS